MADSRPYTAVEKAAQDRATAAANRTNSTVMGRAASEQKAADFIRSKAGSSDGPAEPDYTGMGMVERGAARKKWMQDREEWEKKKAEQAAVRSMK